MFASCSASVHYGITRKGWRPTCLHAARLQFTTASCERAENVGDLHVCKRGCFSSLPHHVNGLATYMFASCRASVHYSIMRKGWRPACSAGLQFTISCERAENVGDLHVCKRGCFSSLPHHVNGLATYTFTSCRASVHYGIMRKGRKSLRPTCLQAGVPQFTTASCQWVGDLHVCKLQGFSSLRHHAKGPKIFATYMFASGGASVHYRIMSMGWRPTCLQAAGLHFMRASAGGDFHVC